MVTNIPLFLMNQSKVWSDLAYGQDQQPETPGLDAAPRLF